MLPQILEMRREAYNLVGSGLGWKFLKKSDEMLAHSSIFSLFGSKMANLLATSSVSRAAVRAGIITDSEVIPSSALQLDKDLAVQVFRDSPPGWMYERVYTNIDCPLVFGRNYHIYFDYWVAQIWNGVLCVRM